MHMLRVGFCYRIHKRHRKIQANRFSDQEQNKKLVRSITPTPQHTQTHTLQAFRMHILASWFRRSVQLLATPTSSKSSSNRTHNTPNRSQACARVREKESVRTVRKTVYIKKRANQKNPKLGLVFTRSMYDGKKCTRTPTGTSTRVYIRHCHRHTTPPRLRHFTC